MARRRKVLEAFSSTERARRRPTRWNLLAALLASVSVGCASAATAPSASEAKNVDVANEDTLARAKAPDAPAKALEAKQGTEARWVTSAHPDLRRLTVVVESEPPEELARAYRSYAKRYGRLEELFLANAGESFGSGFVMVRSSGGAGDAAARRTFIVTNRHVVGMASRVTVKFQEQADALTGHVIHVDDRYDLAVVVLSAAPVEEGFSIEAEPPRDQDLVVASGYPPVMRQPSYQVTRGYVSNERFLIKNLSYVQHTAPIDRGSSGGPLTNEAGAVLGMNTYKVRGRENVGIAVPATVIAAALERVTASRKADELLAPREVPQAACEELVSLLGRETFEAGQVTGSLGARLVAEQGLSSLNALGDPDDELRERFIDEPTEVFLEALAARLRKALPKNAAESETEHACVPVAGQSTGAQVTFEVQLEGGRKKWTFGVEQARWKLIDASLGSPREPSLLSDGASGGKAKGKWKPALKRSR